MKTEAYRKMAEERYGDIDDVKVYSDAKVEIVDGGAWVQAEVWVDNFEMEED